MLEQITKPGGGGAGIRAGSGADTIRRIKYMPFTVSTFDSSMLQSKFTSRPRNSSSTNPTKTINQQTKNTSEGMDKETITISENPRPGGRGYGKNTRK